MARSTEEHHVRRARAVTQIGPLSFSFREAPGDHMDESGDGTLFVALGEWAARAPCSPAEWEELQRSLKLPRRGDHIELWLKRERNSWDGYKPAVDTIDKLLATYREKSDYGLELDEEGGDP